MRDIKAEKSLVGAKHWPTISVVHLEGDPNARRFPEGGISEAEREEIIRSWRKVAVFILECQVPVRVGFYVRVQMQILNCPIETFQGMFGMRIGPDPVHIFVLPEDLAASVEFQILTTGDLDSDPPAKEIPLY